LLLKVPNVARYLVREGREVIIEAEDGAKDVEIRAFLTGSVFGALLQQRNVLPLHASAIRVGDACVALAGVSGAGKSTLAAFLQDRGYPLLGDDICPVHVAPELGAIALPGFARFKLWADALETLGIKVDGFPRVRKELDKYEVVADHRVLEQYLPLRRLYLLCEARDGDPEGIEAIEGPDRLSVLLRNTYRFRYLKGLDLKNGHFKLCVNVLSSVSMFRLQRPWEISRLRETADWLEAHWQDLRAGGSPTSSLPAAA